MTDIQDMESRIIELETRLSFQDDTILQLNDIVAEQSQTITMLMRETYQLKQMMKTLAPSNIAHQSEETPPPHY